MRILSLGAGAVGGYFGGRLAESGADVTFLVRERRRDQLRAIGLRIESPYGDLALPVKATTAGELDGPFDIVVLTCKAYDLASAIEAVRPAVGLNTAVLPLLNGIAHLDLLNREFGRDRVLGGLARIAVTMTPEGVIRHLNDWREVVFGEQDGRRSERVTVLEAAFDRTSVTASAVSDIMQKMWEKLVHLATAAGMTSTMRASVGEIARTEYGSDLALRFLETNAEIAAREGFRPSDAFMADYRKLFSGRTSDYTASMLRDVMRGGPVEADHVLGFMLRKAQMHGIDDMLHRFVYVHLKAYEERRAAGRL